MEPSQTPTEFSLNELRESPDNPRFITDHNFSALGTSMKEFGDLSCFVKNIRTGNLVGGSQRSKVAKAFQDGKIIIERRWEQPTAVGTVAVGKVVIFGEPFGYREVNWDLERETAANIAANSGRGEFDQEKLANNVAKLSEKARKLTGQTQEKMRELLQRSSDNGKLPAAKPKVFKAAADEFRPFARELYIGDEDKLQVVMEFLDYVAEAVPMTRS
jgi:hypothetical protein